MALRKLDDASLETTELSASVCIVGAGIAGLIAATRLARDKKRRVVVVESGLSEFPSSVSVLNEIDHRCGNYQGGPDRPVQRFGWYVFALGRKAPSP